MADWFTKIQSYCLAKENAFEDHPWGDTVWKIKPKNKIFAGGGSSSSKVTVRATLDEQAALIQLPGIVPAAYVGRHGWVTVDLDEPQNEGLIFDLIDRSYELVAGSSRKRKHLPKSEP